MLGVIGATEHGVFKLLKPMNVSLHVFPHNKPGSSDKNDTEIRKPHIFLQMLFQHLF